MQMLWNMYSTLRMVSLHIISLRSVQKSLLISDRFANRTPPPLIKVRRIPCIPVQIALWAPLATLPWLKLPLAVHYIDLLKSKILSLVEEEIHDDGGSGVGTEEDEAETIADARVGEGRQERNHEVTEPR